MIHLSFVNQISIPRALTAESIRIEISLHVKKKPAEKIYPFLPGKKWVKTTDQGHGLFS
jgi:hypothetical protein